MSKIYTVKAGDIFGAIALKAMKDNPYLTSEQIEQANSHIKNFDEIHADETITIPDAKPKSNSLNATPTEGKCGNQFTYIPLGEHATMMSVSGKLNGKSTPNLEPSQTYTLERKKIEESQQGSLSLKVKGKPLPLIDDVSPFKEKINAHKDVKVSLTLIDKEWLVPAKPAFQIPEFRSPDQDATMTEEEFVQSQIIYQSHLQTLADFGIHVNASEKHSLVAVELPPNVHLEIGTFDIDKMKDEAVEKFTQAMAIATASGNKEALSKFGAELFTLGLIPGLAKEKKAFWKQMGLKGKFVISIEKGVRIVQFYPTTHFTAAWKEGATRAEQKKLKKGLVKYNKKYPLGQTEFAKQLKQAIPFLTKVKVGYLEKFLSGLSRGGTVISIIFIGGADTAKWYFDKKSQSVDLWAIWGVAIATGAIAAAAYNATAGLTALALAGTALSGSIVIVVGTGIIVSVAVAWVVGSLISKYKVKENFIDWLRTMERGEVGNIEKSSLASKSLSYGGL